MDSKSQGDTQPKDNGAKVHTKRGRPRKESLPTVACSQRMGTLRNRSNVRSWKQRFHTDTRSVQDHSLKKSFKRTGLKEPKHRLLHTPNTCKPSKRKFNMDSYCEIPAKRPYVRRNKPEMKCKVTQEGNDCNTVDFRNPVKLTFINNVKIVVDKTFSDRELSLKQLQEMKPLVVIKKLISSCS